MLFLAFLTTALAVPPLTPAVDASVDDCAIVIAIGRAEASWGPRGPNLPFIAEVPDANGTIYRQLCPWRALGVGPPKLADPALSDARFSIGRPTYGSGGRTAETDLAILGPPRRPGGPPLSRFKHCRLEKAKGRWRLIACTDGPIS